MARTSITVQQLREMTKKSLVGMVIRHGPHPGLPYRITEVTETGLNATPVQVNTDWEPHASTISIPATAEIAIEDSDNRS